MDHLEVEVQIARNIVLTDLVWYPLLMETGIHTLPLGLMVERAFGVAFTLR